MNFAAVTDGKIFARSLVNFYVTSHAALATSQDSANAEMGKDFDRFNGYLDGYTGAKIQKMRFGFG